MPKSTARTISPIPSNDDRPNPPPPPPGTAGTPWPAAVPGRHERRGVWPEAPSADGAATLGLGLGEYLFDLVDSTVQGGVKIPLLELLDEGAHHLLVASPRQSLAVFASALDIDLGGLPGDQDVEPPRAVTIRTLGEDLGDIPAVERIDGLDGDRDPSLLLQFVEPTLPLPDGVGGEHARIVADRRGVRRGDRGRQDQR